MKFDTIIIGGGLSGLTCAIRLAEEGQLVALVASGQSHLHFSSGSFGLLGYDSDSQTVVNPLDALAQLSVTHPYYKIGVDKVKSLAEEAKALLLRAELRVKGRVEENHLRLSPIGKWLPAWLSLDEMATINHPEEWKDKKVLLVNVSGFMDFSESLVAEQLEKTGTKLRTSKIVLPELLVLRQSPSEMRATNIARKLTNEVVDKLGDAIQKEVKEETLVLLPAILGLDSAEIVARLQLQIGRPLQLVPTLPPSVSGTRIQRLLERRFRDLGGRLFSGDTVVGGNLQTHRLEYILTQKLEGDHLEANHFVWAAGSFMSHGLSANYESVFEPIFKLDVDAASQRIDWTHENVLHAQPYMNFGLRTDEDLHPLKDGSVIENMYAVGSILSGHNSVKQGDGEGVSLLTALAVASIILNR